jgi:hypothetical protein
MNPRQPKLRGWDMAFLLRSLSSLLQEIPISSVRLAAFNLDQQNVIFRCERLDSASFDELARALRHLELWVISSRALDRNRPTDVLADLVNKELAAQEPSDAVIFLGPNLSVDRKIPPRMLQRSSSRAPQFFYFEYFPFRAFQFPDTIHYLTKTLHGTVFEIRSAGDLGNDISKMLSQLRPLDTKKSPAQ